SEYEEKKQKENPAANQEPRPIPTLLFRHDFGTVQSRAAFEFSLTAKYLSEKRADPLEESSRFFLRRPFERYGLYFCRGSFLRRKYRGRELQGQLLVGPHLRDRVEKIGVRLVAVEDEGCLNLNVRLWR